MVWNRKHTLCTNLGLISLQNKEVSSSILFYFFNLKKLSKGHEKVLTLTSWNEFCNVELYALCLHSEQFNQIPYYCWFSLNVFLLSQNIFFFKTGKRITFCIIRFLNTWREASNSFPIRNFYNILSDLFE